MKAIAVTVLLTALLNACFAEIDDDEALDTATTEAQLAVAGLTGNCYASGGVYWCQDHYTAKWCTTSRTANGWDWTNCTWSGWRDDRYCSNGWQWAASHTHCD